MRETSTKRRYRMTDRAETVAATRERILDAALEIADPRAPLATIADRAGVSQRTVLRHFGNRGGLFTAAIEVGDARIRAERFSVPAGELEAAVANLVGHYERHGDQVITRLAQEGQDERVDRVLDSGRQLHRLWVEEKLGPLLDGCDARTRRRRLAQLVAACDVYTWKLLRRDSGLSRNETEKAIAELVRGLTAEGGSQ
jgi:AcrR family transcriptional regulator